MGPAVGWQVMELSGLAADQPWTRADFIVAGHSTVPHNPQAEAVVRGI